jgi:polyhydroxyalkanoate synthesis regulator phasin
MLINLTYKLLYLGSGQAAQQNTNKLVDNWVGLGQINFENK